MLFSFVLRYPESATRNCISATVSERALYPRLVLAMDVPAVLTPEEARAVGRELLAWGESSGGTGT